MSLDEAIKTLEDHNKWRRGDDAIIVANPIKVGQSIDVILKAVRDAYNVGDAIEKLWTTEVEATCPNSGKAKRYCGPTVKAISPRLAQEFCNQNGLGYCKVVGELVAEIATHKDGVSPDFNNRIDFGNSQLN